MKHLSAEKISWIKNHIPTNREEYLAICQYAGTIPVRFPHTVYIEVGSACNLNCKFCSKPTRRNFDEEMDEETLFRVVDECAANGVYSIYCHLFNEPLLHWEKLIPVIERAKRAGIPVVAVTTNGTMLNEGIMQALIGYGLDTLHFSFEGASTEIYREVRGGEVETIDEKIRMAVRMRNEAGNRNAHGQLKPWIAITMMKSRESQQEINGFLNKWKRLIDNIEVRPVLGFLGRTEMDEEHILTTQNRIPCRYLGDRLIVAADGSVTGCSVDLDAALNLGNVSRGQSLAEIWNSEKYRDLWSLHQWQKWDQLPEPCRSCDSWDFLATERSRSLKD